MCICGRPIDLNQKKPSPEQAKLKSRNWFASLNNPGVPAQEFLERIYKDAPAVYVTGQLERGDGTDGNPEGTIHI